MQPESQVYSSPVGITLLRGIVSEVLKIISVLLVLVYNNNNNNNNNNNTILWNQQVQTEKTIPNNKPDIVIRDNEKGTCMLIDVAIPGDRNVIRKEAEEILKCKYVTVEIQRMWNVKTGVIPVIIGATGTISKSFIKYVSTIPGNYEVR
jgi:hypothetical protein